MSLPDRTTVLIVGAGPAGLSAALSLLHHGCRDFIIVDAVLGGKNSSRAVVLHAATLEALDTIGCGDDIISQGNKTTALNIGTRSTTLCGPYIDGLKSYTRHPYILEISQNVTESVLEKKLTSLGIHVRRPLKVVGLKSNVDDLHLSDVTFEDGRTITAKYVIGADGAHSVIRAMAGIGFSDPTVVKGVEDNNLAQMIVADVTFDNVVLDNAISATLTPGGLFLCFPLPPSLNESLAAAGQISTRENIYRIGCGVPLAEGDIPHVPSKEYLQSLVDRFGPHCLSSNPAVNPSSKTAYIRDVIWHSRFRNQSRIADTIFTRLRPDGPAGDQGGVVLLVGDAAHIHSPLGGQGMGLGLRDAIFLGEVLTKHIHVTETKPDDDTILCEFASARYARALEVIKLTKRMLSITGMKYRERVAWWCPVDSATVRAFALWVIGCLPFVQNKMAWELSGLGRR